MSLSDKDRIFTNVYGYQDWGLKAAEARGDWDDTKALIERGQVTVALGYIALSLLGSLAALWAGLSITRMFA